MSARVLRAVTAPTGDAVLSLVVPALAAALDGNGPALLPLPADGTRGRLLAALRPHEPLDVDDTALVVPTSGSTGEPKGVILTGSALRHAADAAHDRLGGPGQWLLALPVTHIGGLSLLVRSLLARIEPVVVDVYGGFSVDAFAAAALRMRDDVPRYTALVPTQVHRLLDADVDLTSFDAILVGGAAAPERLLARAAQAGAAVVVSYGMTETCGGCVYDGRALSDVEVSLTDDDRIVISGPVVFSGYRLRPDLSAAALVDGRHLTQDIGRRLPDGRLEVLGRADDVIVSGGVNVCASSVEQVLGTHPDVRAAVVVARHDDEWGQRVVAVVQPRARGRTLTLGELRSFAATCLAPAELPRELIVVDHMPTLTSGKPDRVSVRGMVAG